MWTYTRAPDAGKYPSGEGRGRSAKNYADVYVI